MDYHSIKSCGKRHAYCRICRPDVVARIQEARQDQPGHPHTDEAKIKISASWNDNRCTNQYTPELRARISKSVSRSLIGNQRAKGNRFRHSPETITRMRLAQSSRTWILTPEIRLKIAKGVAKAYARGDYFNHPTSLEYALQLLLEFAGLEYEAQVRFGRYVVDFWVPSHRLVFEADGMFWYHHQDKEREARRDEYLQGREVISVIHLDDHDLETWKICRQEA